MGDARSEAVFSEQQTGEAEAKGAGWLHGLQVSMKQGLGYVVLSSVHESNQGFFMLLSLAPPKEAKIIR